MKKLFSQLQPKKDRAEALSKSGKRPQVDDKGETKDGGKVFSNTVWQSEISPSGWWFFQANLWTAVKKDTEQHFVLECF